MIGNMKTLADNPIVVRAFRVGFRPGGFRMGLWLAILLVILGIILVPALVAKVPAKDVCYSLVMGLLFFTGLSFVFGGLQRTLSAFATERERGTFDFLHLSTMRPSSMIFGFLFAGQLPGYLLLLFTLPVMVICALIADLSVSRLLLLVGMGVFYVLVFSILYMLVGFWMRKIADLRSGAVLLTIIVLLVVGGIVRLVIQAGYTNLGPPEFLCVLTVWPVFELMMLRVVAPAKIATRFMEVGFFGYELPIDAHAPLFLAPIAIIAFFSLRRSIRHRERRPLSNWWGLALILWIQFYFTGVLYGDLVAAPERVTVMSVLSYVLVFFFVIHRGFRTVPATARVAAHVGGDVKRMILNAESPPYLLVAGLSCVSAIMIWLQGGVGDSVAPLAVLAVPLFLPLYLLIGQWLTWRAYSIWWLHMFQGLVVWLPIILYAVAVAFQGLPYSVPLDPARAVTSVSPLVQVWTLSNSAQGAFFFSGSQEVLSDTSVEHAATLVVMSLTVVATIALAFLHVKELKRIAALNQPHES